MSAIPTAAEREGIRHAPRRKGVWIGLGAVVVVAALIGVAALAGWFGSGGTRPTLLGAGATFPYPLIKRNSPVILL